MKIRTIASTLSDTDQAVEECLSGLDLSPDELTWLLVSYTEGYDSIKVSQTLTGSFDNIPIHGGTSCLGVMSGRGFHSEQGNGMGMFAIADPNGSYGVGAAEIGDDPCRAAGRALEAALEDAGRVGEMPDMVWMNAAPGREEELIRGIADVIGPDVPIAGGSTGDNAIAGKWCQLARTRIYSDAVVISVFFPSVKLSYAFHSGYDPTAFKGTVTKASSRTLYEIDGRPAAEVYNKWTEGLIGHVLETGGNVLRETTLAPVGREVGRVANVPFFKLSHPYEVTVDGAVSFFADINVGEQIILMTGSRDSLITRAGRVTQAAISAGAFAPGGVKGAMLIYCAGCMMTVGDEMEKVVEEVNTSLWQKPFLGMFTFGEQGCFVGHENSHGNLMISVVVFGSEMVG